MEHHGASLLRLAGLDNFLAWQAAQTVLGFPKQIPDGLLDVTFPDKPTPDPFLIEIESYPDPETLNHMRRDVAMVLLTRGVIPDVLLLVLRPKGNLAVQPEQVVSSARGLTEWRLKVRVVNLWTVPVEDVLAAGDVGLIPWAPLAHYDGPPEALLRQCREGIEELGKAEERDNLVTMMPVMAAERYTDPRLLSILGGQIVTIEKGLLETSTVKQLMAEKQRETAQRVERETISQAVLRLLAKRLGEVPEEGYNGPAAGDHGAAEIGGLAYLGQPVRGPGCFPLGSG